jgi:leucyl-tRNA synthetase
LANEQVIDGRGWRSGALVEKREIPGYYLCITRYAQELLDPLQDGLSGWPERVKAMQENWIGKSMGVRFAFTHHITNEDGHLIQDGKLYVFTTRADTIMGVTYCAVAPEHPLAALAATRQPEVAAFIERCSQGGTTEAELATKEKEGIATGLSVTHPLTGESIPVWVANYVLMSYGDGAVMGVPAHDERDFAFAQKYTLPIQPVITWENQIFDAQQWHERYADKQQGVCIHSGILDGLHHEEAVSKVAELLAATGRGEKKTTWRLRDWGISRQRYWGTPIPIIHCPDCGAVPVPEKDLPVVLPENLIPDGSGNPLKQCASFLNVKCPRCGHDAQRETDTMDTFVDSSWYFMRYCDATNNQAMVGDGARYWLGSSAPTQGIRSGMDQYIGGIEHAILHLLYARFWTKVMRDLGLVQVDEPFTRLLTQGMVLNHIYSRRTEQGGIEYFWPHEVENTFDAQGKINGALLKQAKGSLPAGTAITYEGIGTMSKSKNNGVDPQELIDRYGADTARLFVMFAAPPEQTLEWNDAGVEGAHRFIKRVWAFANKLHNLNHARTPEAENTPSDTVKALRREIHLTLKQISFDYQRMQYNTVVSGCMKLLNALESHPLVSPSDADIDGVQEGFSILLRALYPVCPHLSHILWSELGYASNTGVDILDAPWPHVDESALVQDEIQLMLQINGKLRGSLTVPAQADQDQITQAALASPEFIRFSSGTPPKKVIVVPGRLVNVVV